MPLPIRQVGPLQGRAPNTGGITMGSNNFAASPGMSTPMQRQRAPAQQDNSAANGMAGLSMLNEAGALDPLKSLAGDGFSALQAGVGYHPAGGLPAMAGSSLPGTAGLASNAGLAGLQSAGEFGGMTAAQMGIGGAAGSAITPAMTASSAPMMAAGSLTGATALPASALVGGAAQGAGLAASAPAFLGMGPLGWAACAGLAASAPAFLGMGPLGWAALTGVGLLTAFG